MADWSKIPRTKRRWLRRHPAPEPPPEGMVERNHDGQTYLLPASLVTEVCEAEMDGYDDDLQWSRDWQKEHKHKP